MPTAEYADLFDLDSDANGDPILVDPVSGDTMATWDRSEGAWIPATIGTAADPVPGTSHFDSVSTDEVSINIADAAGYHVFQDGGDYVVVNSNGVEQQRGADFHTVMDAQLTSDDDSVYILRKGTYTLTSTLLLRTATIRGVGRKEATIRQADEANLTKLLDAYAGCSLENVTIDGNGANNTSGVGFGPNGQTDITLQNVDVVDTPGVGVEALNDCHDFTAQNVTVNNAGGNGIDLVGDRVEAADCRVFNSGSATSSAGIQTRQGTGQTIDRCVAKDNAGNGFVVNNGSSDSTVSNCRAIANNGNAGIVVSASCQGVTVEGCIARNNTTLGISIDTNVSSDDQSQEPGDHTVSGCVVTGSGSNGINIQNTPDTTVSGCTSYGNANVGIYLVGSQSDGSTLGNCRARNNDRGVVVDAENCAVTGCVLLGNTSSNYVDNSTDGTATAANVTV